MVTLVVATTTDPASIGPASALLAMPGWQPGLSFEGITSFVNEDVRLLQHDKGIVEEDHLDKRWEQASSEVVHELIFLSKHTAVSNRPALTIHPIGVPHLRQGDVPLQGGKPGWAAPPSPRMAPWLKLLKTIAESRGLIPEFEITLEATHHGPETNTPTMFVEIAIPQPEKGFCKSFFPSKGLKKLLDLPVHKRRAPLVLNFILTKSVLPNVPKRKKSHSSSSATTPPTASSSRPDQESTSDPVEQPSSSAPQLIPPSQRRRRRQTVFAAEMGRQKAIAKDLLANISSTVDAQPAQP
ncbi:D-aminoacyl-tRNA deacylase-like isoform X4 [Camellia sinensis]|uniref:D-aminoacyl-tRNA deacylase-like isoform X4 n=1 Tax=Camellia sinensis TaxID=4442 RepID=UPI001036BA32|nr:D-aminoacyl-tRNA deacylase-like isoform X4 [Camellia sinensis]